jgi:DNA repair protein SbcC/Rad50
VKIKSVTLQDVKSYDDSSPSISFQSGVNAIIGENGSGKSTLCEAIGFALFDFLHPYSQADFVREGKKSGKVSVTFESDDNRVYRVDRGVNQSKYDVFDVTEHNKKLELQGKNDVLNWLKEELGVPRSMDLQTLWKSSLGVPQGKFTNDFAETPSIRAQLFNPLLEVDVYRDLWKDMKHVIDVLRSKKDTINEKITRLESVVEELPDLKKQGNILYDQIKRAADNVKKIDGTIQETEQKKKLLESLQKEIDRITHHLEVQQEKQKDLDHQLGQTKKQFEEAKQAKAIVKKHTKSYEDYVSNSEKLDLLSKEIKEKQALEKKAVALEKKYSRYQDQLTHVKEEIRVACKSKEKMEQLKPLVEKQENLEEKLANLKQKEKEIKRLKQDKEQVNEKISRLRKDFRSLQQQIKEISKKKDVAKKKEELQQQKDDLLQDQSVLTHLQKEHADSISLLKSEEESVCPTCNRPLDMNHRNEIIGQKQKEIKNAKEKLKRLKQQLQSVDQDLQKSVEASQELKRLSDLTSMKENIQHDADEQKKHKNDLEESVISLKKDLAKKQEIIDELDQLNDPKKRFQQARVRYEDHKDREERSEQLKKELSKIEADRKEISTKLKDFESVQDQIDKLNQKQKELKESYELYLQYKDAASKVSFWKEQLRSVESSLETIKQNLSSLSKELKKKEKKFDEDEFNQIKIALEKQKQQLVRQKTQIDEWSKQKEELEKRVTEKEQQKKELDNARKKQYSLKKDIEFAQFLRETYQKTRPLVTEILVEEISREADRIYRELRGVPSEELAWKKDYEIVVYESGNKRAFHKLSGGEQMCAALSVRLAILKLLSTMDIVFLDEPTMNLDEEKKDNLVAQLRELSGFSQIFVISHDETFESMTEHVITLEKRKGATRLLTHFQGGF